MRKYAYYSLLMLGLWGALYAAEPLNPSDDNRPQASLPLRQNSGLRVVYPGNVTKRVRGVYLSNKAQNALKGRMEEHTAVNNPLPRLPSQVDLSMNGVPIFDQGDYLTCTTFAVTAALDAVLGKGDYISQLCLLELGNQLHQTNFSPNPWEGAFAEDTLNLIRNNGVISKSNQLKGVCGGIVNYNPDAPDNDPAPKALLSPTAYHPYSEPLINRKLPELNATIAYRELFNSPSQYLQDDAVAIKINGPLEDSVGRYVSGDEALNLVKTALSKGQRVIIGALIDLPNPPAQGMYLKKNDTWFLTKQIKADLYNTSGKVWGSHEIIVYGYNDDAIATSPNGAIQQGLFYVRNSWGTKTPDAGIEFMTYDYLKLLTLDAFSIYAYKP